ncbi:hypothetical protein BVX97_01950 [bacterium E08(2017)]|nr:hypothetical protein BVX97_01950 [bacterium E08(2017)]
MGTVDSGQWTVGRKREAFTLLELLLALSLLSIISVVTYLTFSTCLRAWRKGTSMTESLHHGDYVMEQLVMGVRSMYYPGGDAAKEYGFWHTDSGTDEYSGDEISWVKLGSSLVGSDSPLVDTPHRVKFYLHEDEEKDRVYVAMKAWQLLGQPEEFDPEEIEPVYLSRKVVGFNCRPAWQIKQEDDEIDWQDEWEQTNKIPTAMEITLYLEPAEEDGDPVVMQRIVGIPVGPVAWTK